MTEPSEEKIPIEMSSHEVEKAEEAKLHAMHPEGINPAPGRISKHSAFLQKRLAKGQKFFDSGDYQMAKQKMNVGASKHPLSEVPINVNPFVTGTGDAIPTPETVSARKASIIQPAKFMPTQNKD